MNTKSILAAAAVMAMAASCSNEIQFDACGQIEATQVTVSAESNGRLLSFDVTEGDKVTEGQILGGIDSVQTVLQIRELEQRMKGAATRMVDINRQSEPNRSQLASLENELARFTKLLESSAATQKQVDELCDKIALLKAQMSAQAQSWERGNASVNSEIETYGIQLAQRRDQLSKCTVTAPVSGTVMTRYAEKGENVTAGKPLLKIADMDNVFVRAYFTTSQLADLKLGDTVKVIPDDGSASPKEYQGRIVWISDQAEFTPKNIQTRDERADMVYAVKVAVANDGYLRLGMYAYIRK